MVKGVIFDVDGTLLDSMIIWADAGKRFVESLGYKVTENIDEIMFEMTIQDGAQFLIDKYGLTYSIEEICDAINAQTYDFYANEAQPKEGVVEFFDYLYKNNIPMTIATATDRPMIEAAFKRLGWEKYFKRIFTNTEIGKGKDHPDMFLKAMEVMGSNPESTWLFEDGAYSMKTGRKLGLNVVGVYDFFNANKQEEVKALADFYIEDWKNYKQVIKVMNV